MPSTIDKIEQRTLKNNSKISKHAEAIENQEQQANKTKKFNTKDKTAKIG